MWERFYFVTLVLCPVLSKLSPDHIAIEKILGKLGNNLDYISQNYDKINVDCLFGVVFADVILDDTITHAGPYQEQAKALKAKTREIYTKSRPLMQENQSWDFFTKYMVVPDLWLKSLNYKLSEFPMAHPMKSPVQALLSINTNPYENYSEVFSDHCLFLVINSTLDLKPNAVCRLDPKCENFVESLEEGSGYILTHKLLLLQVAKVRKCNWDPKILANDIKKVCTTIYTETISVEHYRGLDEIFDLFLEQILLCGYEGFADFLKIHWLEKILETQHESGCFPYFGFRNKRETHDWKDGCADHTTGLGAAVLSLYLNYIVQNV